MAGKNTATFGIYRTREEAELGVEALLANGFRQEDVSVLFALNSGNKAFAFQKESKAPEGVMAGVCVGGAVCGTVGYLAAIGSIAISVLEPYLVAGPWVSALAGVGCGALIGGLTGGLVGRAMPEYVAKRHEGMVREGGVLISAHCDNAKWVARAKEVLEETGAKDISSAGEADADYAVSDKPKPRPAGTGVL